MSETDSSQSEQWLQAWCVEKHFVPLPQVYEQYLAYRLKSGQVTQSTLKQIRRVLVAFYWYLKSAVLDCRCVGVIRYLFALHRLYIKFDSLQIDGRLYPS
jgi:hypothetical protein